MCAALTTALDEALTSLSRGIGSSASYSVVAVGGYGRAELSIYSDVDLMVLHEEPDPSEIAAAVFRPLWDANLRLGHSVRTISEAGIAASQRYDTHTSLLTCRLIAGDEKLFRRLKDKLRSVTRTRPLRQFLVSEEKERRRRHPYLTMAADLKEGRGGLRTLQALEWERRQSELLGVVSDLTSEEEVRSRDSLLAIRNALHAISGRSYDTFSHDLRSAVGRWLDLDPLDTGAMLTAALTTADRLASSRWPELLVSVGPGAGFGRRSRGSTRFRPRRGGRTTAAAAQQDLAPLEPPGADEFLGILRGNERGRFALAEMEEAGGLSQLLPEWSAVSVAPQMAPFHEHSVGVHLWRTVDEMIALMEGSDDHYREISAEVNSEDTLLLAAFLHDIGKGSGGDHATVGAAIARSFCERAGFSKETSTLVEGAVRHHLLLSRTAARRDIDDPAVIEEVVRTVGDLRRLQVVYLLTVADSKATGATMWSEWKATLLRTLFVRCAARFGADRPVHDPEVDATLDAVRSATEHRRRGEAERHVRSMPADYLRSTSVEEVLWHLDLLDELTGCAHVGVRSGGGAETTVVVGKRQPGFRLVVAETFAANGIDVLQARMLSRADGMILDTFHVRDDRGGGSVDTEKWNRARMDLESALTGGLNTESKVAERAAAYATNEPSGFGLNVKASIDPASRDTVITIHCSDRVGRLAEILRALYQTGLEIHLAKLDSRGREVVDTFYVREDGHPLPDRDPLDLLEKRIMKLIEP